MEPGIYPKFAEVDGIVDTLFGGVPGIEDMNVENVQGMEEI